MHLKSNIYIRILFLSYLHDLMAKAITSVGTGEDRTVSQIYGECSQT